MSEKRLGVLLPVPATPGDDQVGGVATFCSALLEALGTRGDISAHIIRPASTGQATRRVEVDGLEVVEVGVGTGPWHRRLGVLCREATHWMGGAPPYLFCADYWVVPPDLPDDVVVTTFVHLLPSQLAVRLAAEVYGGSSAAWRRGLERALTLASRWPFDGLRPAVSLAKERSALRRSGRILVNHDTLRTTLEGRTRAPIQTIDLGYPSLTGPPMAQKEARRELGLAVDELLLLTCGRLHRQKGLHTLIDAAGMARAGGGRRSLVMLGPDCEEGYTRSLRRRAARYPHLELRMPGAVSPAARDVWLAAADGYLSGAIYEPHGLSVREAIVAQLPAVGVAIDGLVGPLQMPGNIGIAAHPRRDRSARLARAIDAVLSSPYPSAASRPPLRTLLDAAQECLDRATERPR